MKYTIGDIFIWKYDKEELSTLIEVYYDWDGEQKYRLESLVKLPMQEYIREAYTEKELDKYIRIGIITHYPVR